MDARFGEHISDTEYQHLNTEHAWLNNAMWRFVILLARLQARGMNS